MLILGYIVSVISSLFSIYKFRSFLRERAQKLKAAGIEPNLKRIVFFQRTLANHSKVMLLCIDDSLSGCNPSSDREVQSVRDVRKQLLQMQEQLRQHQRQFEIDFHQQQQEINQLKQKLQHARE
jgi:hypothetical protein